MIKKQLKRLNNYLEPLGDWLVEWVDLLILPSLVLFSLFFVVVIILVIVG